MTRIDIDVVRPDMTAWGNATIAVRLVDAGAGGSVEESVISGTQRILCDADGHAQVDLTPNGDISPAGSFYAFTVERAVPGLVRCIEVPAPNIVAGEEVPYSWADTDIQVLVDTPPVYIPALTVGAEGKVPIVNATGDGYELQTPGGGGGAVSSVDGQTGAVDLSGSYDPLGAATAAGAAAVAAAAALVDDLSGVSDAPTARTNLGLGTAATEPASAFAAAAHAAQHAAAGSDPVMLTAAQVSGLGLLAAKSSIAAGDIDEGTVLPPRRMVPNAQWTAGTGYGTLVADMTAGSTAVLSPGDGFGCRTDMYAAAASVVVIRTTASALSAGQSIIVYTFAIDATTGLPTGAPLTTTPIVVGASVAIIETTGLSVQFLPGTFNMILNPSTNAGSVTLTAIQPARGNFGGNISTSLAVPALRISGQGATISSVTGFTIGSTPSSTRWAYTQYAPAILVR